MSTEVRSLYERWLYELWTSGDAALAGQLVTTDFVGHWPDQDVHGPDELAAIIQQSLAFFADVTTTIEVGPSWTETWWPPAGPSAARTPAACRVRRSRPARR